MNLSLTRLFAILLLGLLAPLAAQGDPILSIEAGMHTAQRDLDVDPSNRLVATAGEDKTVRLWDAADGRLIRVLRPPIGAESEGSLNAVAFSPDGKLVAATGWTSPSGHQVNVYIFDVATGRMVRRVPDIDTTVMEMAWSPDGQFLALASRGITVVRTSDWSVAFKDTSLSESSRGLAFSHDSRHVAIVSYDRYLRLYSVPAFEVVRRTRWPEGMFPATVAFSPDNQTIAVGFRHGPLVHLLKNDTLDFISQPTLTTDSLHGVSTITWSRDGSILAAGGGYWQAGCPVVFWNGDGSGPGDFHPVAIDTISSLKPRIAGGFFMASTEPRWSAVSELGTPIFSVSSPIPDFRNLLSRLAVSSDGATVTFAYRLHGQDLAEFDVVNRSLRRIEGIPPGLQSAITTSAAIPLGDCQGVAAPQLNGQPIAIHNLGRIFSSAVAQDDSFFVLAGAYQVARFDPQGGLVWAVDLPNTAWTANITPDQSMVVVAMGNGTIRWMDAKDGSERLNLFLHNDGERWVLYNSQGYYDCSSGAENLLGWHVNKGPDAAADFFPVSRFRKIYYRPDVIDKSLQGKSTFAALTLATDETGASNTINDSLALSFPPVVSMLTPTEGETIRAASVKIRYTVRTDADSPITVVRALIDGRPVPTARAVSRPAWEKATVDVAAQDALEVPLPGPGTYELALIAENRHGASEAARVRITVAGAAGSSAVDMSGADVLKPKLYALVVGVGEYEKPELALRYPAKDARDFAAALEGQKGGLYSEVTIRLLADKDAHRDDIMDGLEWLQKQTTARDVAVLFLAGHGLTDSNLTYFYLPVNADPEKLLRTCVRMSDIRDTLANIPGKALFFVDTCHAGNALGNGQRARSVDVNGLVNELASAENGAVVFASSTGRQVSWEDEAWENGAFTKALVEGLGGAAARDGKITIALLEYYIAERVKTLTEGRQTPTVTKPQTVQDFPIAVPQTVQ